LLTVPEKSKILYLLNSYPEKVHSDKFILSTTDEIFKNVYNLATLVSKTVDDIDIVFILISFYIPEMSKKTPLALGLLNVL